MKKDRERLLDRILGSHSDSPIAKPKHILDVLDLEVTVSGKEELLEYVVTNWGLVEPSGANLAFRFPDLVFEEMKLRRSLQKDVEEAIEEAKAAASARQLSQRLLWRIGLLPERDAMVFMLAAVLLNSEVPIPFVELPFEVGPEHEEAGKALLKGLGKEIRTLKILCGYFQSRFRDCPMKGGYTILHVLNVLSEPEKAALLGELFKTAGTLPGVSIGIPGQMGIVIRGLGMGMP